MFESGWRIMYSKQYLIISSETMVQTDKSRENKEWNIATMQSRKTVSVYFSSNIYCLYVLTCQIDVVFLKLSPLGFARVARHELLGDESLSESNHTVCQQ